MGDSVSSFNTPISDMKDESAASAKDPKTRRLLVLLSALWFLTVLALIAVTWRAYFDERDKSQTLAQQIALACSNGDFGVGFSKEDQKALCENAKKVLKNQGEVQDDEIQEAEIQDPEIQEAERQEAERQESEDQESEDQESEQQESEQQESESQEDEVQDPEIQDDEIQDPEIDDPDPASPYDFSFEFTIPANGDIPAQTFTVMCNSGTGLCVVTGG